VRFRFRNLGFSVGCSEDFREYGYPSPSAQGLSRHLVTYPCDQ